MYSLAALGLAALSVGDLADASADLQQSGDLACRLGVGNPDVVPMAADLAEALARAQQMGRREVVHWLDERAPATGLAYPQAAACRVRGILVTEPEEAESLFAASLAALDKNGPMPFEHARTLLCSGEAMRRNHRPPAARAPLNRALEIFDGLGARL